MANESVNQRNGFIRTTVSIPQELSGFIDSQKKQPTHAGSLSSYVRGLIIADKQAKQFSPSETKPEPVS